MNIITQRKLDPRQHGEIFEFFLCFIIFKDEKFILSCCLLSLIYLFEDNIK